MLSYWVAAQVGPRLPGYAVDGITVCDLQGGTGVEYGLSITNGGAGNEKWWTVDLGNIYVVTEVIIYGRNAEWADQSSKLGVFLSNSSSDKHQTTCTSSPKSATPVGNSVSCSNPRPQP